MCLFFIKSNNNNNNNKLYKITLFSKLFLIRISRYFYLVTLFINFSGVLVNTFLDIRTYIAIYYCKK